jgi:hypothetical protein
MSGEHGPRVTDRRRFLAVAAGVIFDVSFAHAQGPTRIVRVGFLSSAGATTGASNLDVFRAGLQELGYVEGRNIAIETRWGDGNLARLSSLAAELARLKVEVICAVSTPATLAAKEATTTIPIVFLNVAFPTQTGLVASYPRPAWRERNRCRLHRCRVRQALGAVEGGDAQAPPGGAHVQPPTIAPSCWPWRRRNAGRRPSA